MYCFFTRCVRYATIIMRHLPVEHQRTNVNNSIFLEVAPEKIGMRLDSFLGSEIDSYSRTFFQQTICKGLVEINGAQIIKPAHRVCGADRIAVSIPPFDLPPAHPDARNVGVELIYSHEHFFIVNKPAFLAVHAPHPNSQPKHPTLVDWIVTTYCELKNVGLGDRPGIVHRLDKNTSGLMIIARTNYGHQIFSVLFKDRAIKKTYLAIVKGHPEQTGSIDFRIIRDPVCKVKMAHSRAYGRESLTNYRVKNYFGEHSLIEAYPVTGRTHQIRVHLAAIGYPLLGDATYGSSSKYINRHALHAWRLSFYFEEKEYQFESSLPEDMQCAVDLISAK